jgi:cAMP phosphodiesterase
MVQCLIICVDVVTRIWKHDEKKNNTSNQVSYVYNYLFIQALLTSFSNKYHDAVLTESTYELYQKIEPLLITARHLTIINYNTAF